MMTAFSLFPSRLKINLSAIKRNYDILQKQAGCAEIAFVLKADAYGLGAREIGGFLKAYARSIFVAFCYEAIELRSILPDADIYVLHGPLEGEIEHFLAHHLIPVLNTKEQIKAWGERCASGKKQHPFALQFDTGMSRFGVGEEDLEILKKWDLSPHLVMSHLACADDPNHPLNEAQYQKFLYFSSFFPYAKRSLVASSGAFLEPHYHFDMIRPGAGLYGINPQKNKKNPFENILELETSLQQVHIVPKGRGVGYDSSFVTERETSIGTFNIGYADGIFRGFSKEGYLSYKGQNMPIIGRISMDSLCVDLTDLKGEIPQIGTYFKLIHRGQDINHIAEKLQTIPYEILTSLGRRFQKIYFEEEK